MADAAAAGWHTGCTFNQFKSDVLPAIQAYDRKLTEQLAHWEQLRNADDTAVSKKTKKKSKPAADIILLANPNNAYPVYLLLKKAVNFSIDRLHSAYDILHRTDGIIKSGSESKTQALERAVIAICKQT